MSQALDTANDSTVARRARVAEGLRSLGRVRVAAALLVPHALPLMVAAVTFLTFWPTLWNGFVEWDDSINLVDNQKYRGLGWAQLRWMFTSLLMGHYIPVTWLSFGLDYAVWGMKPFGYHLTNNLLHTASAVVFYFLARRLLREATGWPAAALRAAAAGAALVFAVHPLRAESVAWATERRDVLSGLFFLLAILAYLRALDVDGRRHRWRLAEAAGCYALAVFAKAIVMTLPLVLVLLDVYPLRRVAVVARPWRDAAWRRCLVEKVPFAALGLAGAAAQYYAVSVNAFVTPLDAHPWTARVGMTFYSLWFYFQKTVLPLGFSPLYELPAKVNPLEGAFLGSAVGVVLLSALAVAVRRRWPALLAVWAYYVIVLGPVTGIVHSGHQLTHDRYSYLSCLGWALLAGGGAGMVARAWASGAVRARVAGMAGAVAGLGLLGLATLTWYQVQIWKDTETLWYFAVDATPDCGICHNNLGVYLTNKGFPQAGLMHLQRSLVLRPDHIGTHGNIGVALANMNRPAEAVPHYEKVLAKYPKKVDVRANLGGTLVRLGRIDEALAHLQEAAKLSPNHYPVAANFALALSHVGRHAEAIPHFRRAIEARPQEPFPHYGLAQAYLAVGQPDVARAEYEALRALDRNLASYLAGAFVTEW